jgi:DNA-3-methyladenine glycosylase II
MMRAFTIQAEGEFSLRESASFGFGQRDAATEYDGAMRLAFCLDGSYEQQVGVVVRQQGPDVLGEVHGPGSLDGVRAQVARVLSLDHDATDFARIGRSDPVLRRLQLTAPGLRPPLFHSAYEAAAWAVLSARRPQRQAALVRAALSAAAGRRFVLAGRPLAALPTPSALLKLGAFPGIEAERLERLHGVARAAADGALSVARLVALGPDDAMADLQTIKGIGPFYASLIVIRGLGLTDVLPRDEPTVLAQAGQLYGLGRPATPEQFEQLAEAWRPWRTWASVYLRAVGPRVRRLTTPLSA